MVRVKAQEILSWFDTSRYGELLGYTTDQILDDIEFRIFYFTKGMIVIHRWVFKI